MNKFKKDILIIGTILVLLFGISLYFKIKGSYDEKGVLEENNRDISLKDSEKKIDSIKSNLIKEEIENIPKLNIKSGDGVYDNFVIRGAMTDGWYDFEGVVGKVKLYDGNNNLISEAILESDNPSGLPENEHKNFIATLYFKKKPETLGGVLIFKNENASGLKEKDREFELDIIFGK